MPSQEQTLDKISSRMKLVGDLPIFSASLNRVRRVSADPDSDAMELAKEIMKDANLSIKVLKLANSPFYNRGRGRISVISRAVVVLGFQTLKNISLTLKLIESFQHEHPSIDMSAVLVRSYLSAGFVQELALKCGVTDVEESYTCALLHCLGEVAVAYFLPDEYIQIQKLQKTSTTPMADIQHGVLGASFAAIGQVLASNWEFPATVVQTMGHYDAERDGKLRDKTQLNRAMASLANKIVGSVYRLEQPENGAALGALFDELTGVTGVEFSGVQNCLIDSFKQSCTLAEEFGLNKTKLMPAVKETGDALEDKLARQFSYYAGAHHGDGDDERAVAAAPVESVLAPGDTPQLQSPGSAAAVSAVAAVRQHHTAAPVAGSTVRLDRQLEFLQEITILISEYASLNRVFTKVVEGLCEGVGFDHALLCLVNRDRSAYSARIALGAKAETLKRYFQRQLDPRADLFSKVLLEGSDLLVHDATDGGWRGMLREDFIAAVGSAGFAIAPLRVDNRPVGFFYTDKSCAGLSITQDEYRGFIQFVSQAKLALQMCGSGRLQQPGE